MKRRVLISAVALFAVGLIAAGCVIEPEQADPAFVNAVPRAQTVQLEVPESAGEKAYGDLAEMYRATVQFTRDVNNSVMAWLFFIEIIVQYPPSYKSKTRHVWGPWLPDDGLSSVHLRFVMDLNLDGSFDYALEMKPRQASESAFVPVFWGVLDPGASVHRSSGIMDFDFDTAGAMDPAVTESGHITIYYDTNIGNKDIYIEFFNFAGHAGDEPVTASYHYDADPGGSGYFDFVLVGDIHADDPNGGQYPNDEVLSLRARWTAQGDGRADALVTGPDLDAQSIEEYTLSECWDNSFSSVFYAEAWTIGGQQHLSPDNWGDPQECTFADFQQPQF